MINGEIVPVLEAIEFSSKDELLTKLRDMREATVRLAPADRRVVKQMLGIAIQEVCYTSGSARPRRPPRGKADARHRHSGGLLYVRTRTAAL